MNTRLHQGVFNCFSRSSNREMFCDFTVVVEGVKFPCHRFVLNACSGFFEALLRSDMIERRKKTVTIQEISLEIFKLILDVIYCGSDVLTQGNMIEMWKASHQLQMEFLVSACEDFVLKNIILENWHIVYYNAKLLLSSKVTQFVVKYIVKNFIAVASSTTFIKLQFEDLLKIIQSNQLSVDADSQIQAILKWCGEESVERTQKSEEGIYNVLHVGDLMQAVNMSKVSKKCLASLLTNKVIQENKEAIMLVNTQASSLINPIACSEIREQNSNSNVRTTHGLNSYGLEKNCLCIALL